MSTTYEVRLNVESKNLSGYGCATDIFSRTVSVNAMSVSQAVERAEKMFSNNPNTVSVKAYYVYNETTYRQIWL